MMLEVNIENDAIRFGSRFSVNFHRTLRIPDDGQTYLLPPGLGLFPILKIEDYEDTVPAQWLETGGVFIPMYQKEALWLGFKAAPWKPNAVKIAVGKVNTISGKPNNVRLHFDPQDYLVCPDQLWLDGINTEHGSIRQFVAMPLGRGYTVEAAVTGTEIFGGIQITVFEPKSGLFPEKPPSESENITDQEEKTKPRPMATPKMGLGAGGLMTQKIYPDPYGLDTWDQENYGRIVVHIVNSVQFLEITGKEPPKTPIDAKQYTDFGLPWFDLYDEHMGDVSPPADLSGIKTISDREKELGEATGNTNSINLSETQTKKLTHARDRTTKSESSTRNSTED